MQRVAGHGGLPAIHVLVQHLGRYDFAPVAHEQLQYLILPPLQRDAAIPDARFARIQVQRQCAGNQRAVAG